MTARASWVAFPRGPPRGRLRLFYFPYAGGGVNAMRPWARALPEGVDVGLVQLPGREARLSEPPLRRIDDLADAAVSGLRPFLDAPFALWGHSMGALVSFEVARRLRAGGLPVPAHLFAWGHRAPHLGHPRAPLHALPDAALVEELARLGGTPEAVLREPDLLALLLPTMRADLEACETYRHAPGEPLSCGISAYGGRDDPDVPLEALEAWRAHTRGRFLLRAFPGGHFFLHGAERDVQEAFAADLRGLLASLR